MLCVSFGYFRSMEVTMAGVNNDQKMLIDSDWNEQDALVSGQEAVAADGGYWTTEHIKITKPFTVAETATDPTLQAFNELFNAERSLIERNFGFLKEKCAIFDVPWKRDKQLLPIALRVGLKLCNRYWRRADNLPPGLQMMVDSDDE